ncbi:ABC transporter substrate-binding protein [Dongia soli]
MIWPNLPWLSKVTMAMRQWLQNRRLWRKVLLFGCLCLPVLPRAANAHEAIETTPSAMLVTDLFENVIDVTFPESPGGNQDKPHRIAAIRRYLAETIDADGIATFIMGRYSHNIPASDTRRPADGLLDFAAISLATMGNAQAKAANKQLAHPRPVLSILNMTVRPDQTRLVATELTLPQGQVLPLTWEIRAQPDGLRIEDVTCFGISLRLMLRSAVASAAAERPEEAKDLGHLLTSTVPLNDARGVKLAP